MPVPSLYRPVVKVKPERVAEMPSQRETQVGIPILPG